jgi:DNA-directed RNA polymerase subunit RPC12/RpoP
MTKERRGEVLRCVKCGKVIQEVVTGKYKVADGTLCRDCFFKIVGEEFERHPIWAPKKSIAKGQKT